MTGKLSVWCRDYMPINTSRKDLFRFAYKPDYLKYHKYKGYEPDNALVCISGIALGSSVEAD